MTSAAGPARLPRTVRLRLVATVVWSAGDVLLAGRAYALVAGLAPAAGRARHLAVYGTSWGIGAIAAPPAATQLLRHAGAAGLWCALSCACLALAALHPRWIARRAPGRGRIRSTKADTPTGKATPLV